MNIRKTVKEAISKALLIPIEKVNDNSSANNTQGWDSLANVRLILELENAFDIMIDPSDLLKMRDYKSICEIVEQYLLKK